jgi:hypothetical protein
MNQGTTQGKTIRLSHSLIDETWNPGRVYGAGDILRKYSWDRIAQRWVFHPIRMIDNVYLWRIELYSSIERKLSICRRKIVGASGCVANEIRILLIFDEDEQNTSEKIPI